MLWLIFIVLFTNTIYSMDQKKETRYELEVPKEHLACPYCAINLSLENYIELVSNNENSYLKLYEGLQQHMESNHQQYVSSWYKNQRKYLECKCHACSEKFFMVEGFIRHFWKYHDKKTEDFLKSFGTSQKICSGCGQNFVGNCGLKDHISTMVHRNKETGKRLTIQQYLDQSLNKNTEK